MTEFLLVVGLLAAMWIPARFYPRPPRYIPIGRGVVYFAALDPATEWTEIGYTEGTTITRVVDDPVWSLEDWTRTFEKVEATMKLTAVDIEALRDAIAGAHDTIEYVTEAERLERLHTGRPIVPLFDIPIQEEEE